MQAVETPFLQTSPSPRIHTDREFVRRGALLPALLAFALGIALGSAQLLPIASAAAERAIDRFTGANRIARPDLETARIGAMAHRALADEWRWSPPGAEYEKMFRRSH